MKSSIFFYKFLFLLLLISPAKVIADDHFEAELAKQKGLYKPLSAVQPQYPRKAQNRGTEGYAIIKFTITEQGTTENAEVVEGKCGDIYSKRNMTNCETFNNSSLKAASKLRYRPTEVNGNSVKTDNVLYRFRYEMEGNPNSDKSILNIPPRDLFVIEKMITNKYLDKAEKKSLELVTSYEDVNFYLGKIYALKNQDALAVEHFNKFLSINYEHGGWYSKRHTLEISAVAIIVEKLFKLEDYRGIIALAPRIDNSRVIVTDNKIQIKNANNLIDLSYLYLGASYLMEGMEIEGKEALLFAKKRTNDKNLIRVINQYLSQIE
jgi:TonB family protein|tara:strand:- start:501 stop:1463 length:963 start_codon:yes stop_codon:yes gene_type:complete